MHRTINIKYNYFSYNFVYRSFFLPGIYSPLGLDNQYDLGFSCVRFFLKFCTSFLITEVINTDILDDICAIFWEICRVESEEMIWSVYDQDLSVSIHLCADKTRSTGLMVLACWLQTHPEEVDRLTELVTRPPRPCCRFPLSICPHTSPSSLTFSWFHLSRCPTHRTFSCIFFGSYFLL